MKRNVALEYTLGEGWLAPWLDGLREGTAVASECLACGDAHFLPLRICPTCRVPCDGWRELSGRATVLFRTTGTDGDFGMVKFHGASGAAIACTADIPPDTTRVMLAACSDHPPKLALLPEPQT